jgi:DNA-binding PadR family transcriptional regulator
MATSVKTRVLGALVNLGQPVWPLDLAHALKTPYGTVYGTLRALYDDGLVVGETERKRPGAGRPARVLYRLTAKGREAAADLRDERTQEA